MNMGQSNLAVKMLNGKVKLNILLVEDCLGDVALIKACFAQSINTVDVRLTHKGRVRDAIEILTAESFDIVISDLSLPDSKGLESVKQLCKQVQGRCPIIVISTISNPRMSVEAIELGAEDFWIKGDRLGEQFVYSILFAIQRFQNKNSLSRVQDYQNYTKGIISFDGLELDISAQCLVEKSGTEDEVRYPLPPREVRILELLMRKAGMVVTRTEIIERVWKGSRNAPCSRVVDRHVSALKRSCPRLRYLITKQYGLGYRFDPSRVNHVRTGNYSRPKV